MPPTPRVSNLTAVGYAKEATFGTALASTLWLPVHDVTPDIMPNVVELGLFQNSRDGISEAIAGIQHNTVALQAPLYPDAGLMLFTGALGSETATKGNTHGTANTLAAAIIAAATNITISTGGYANNDIVQIDTDGSLKSEVRKLTNRTIVGAGPTYTYDVDAPMNFAHSNGVATYLCNSGTFTHTLAPANTLPSFSVENNMNGADLQFFGSVISKFDIKAAPNADAQISYTLDSLRQTIPTPGTPSWPSDTAYGPTGITLTMDGTQDVTPSSIEVSLDNGVKVYDGLQGVNYPTGIVPITRKIGLKATVWLQALAAGYSAADYYSGLTAVSTHSIVVTFTQGTYSLALTIPQAVQRTFPPKPREGEIVHLDLDFGATLQGAPTGNAMTAVAVNARYLPY